MIHLSLVTLKSKTANILAEELKLSGYDQVSVFYDHLEFINHCNSSPGDIILFLIEKKSAHIMSCLDFISSNALDIPYLFYIKNESKTLAEKLSKYHPANTIYEPFTINQLIKMIQLTLKNNANMNIHQSGLAEIIEHNTPELNNVKAPTLLKRNYAFFKSGVEIVKIYFEEIMYVHSDHVYVFLITKTKKIPLRNKLEDVEHYLPAQNFQRIHQRYVVNIDHLTKVTSEAVFIENIELPLSKKYKKTLLQHMNIFT